VDAFFSDTLPRNFCLVAHCRSDGGVMNLFCNGRYNTTGPKKRTALTVGPLAGILKVRGSRRSALGPWPQLPDACSALRIQGEGCVRRKGQGGPVRSSAGLRGEPGRAGGVSRCAGRVRRSPPTSRCALARILIRIPSVLAWCANVPQSDWFAKHRGKKPATAVALVER
jgi:hypothetical protein